MKKILLVALMTVAIFFANSDQSIGAAENEILDPQGLLAPWGATPEEVQKQVSGLVFDQELTDGIANGTDDMKIYVTAELNEKQEVLNFYSFYFLSNQLVQMTVRTANDEIYQQNLNILSTNFGEPKNDADSGSIVWSFPSTFVFSPAKTEEVQKIKVIYFVNRDYFDHITANP